MPGFHRRFVPPSRSLHAPLLLVMVAAFTHTAWAQPGRARLDFTAATRPAYTDTLRALVLFVKFSGDERQGDPLFNYQGWPLRDDPEALPAFAKHLLASSPSPPFPDSSLTAYYYQQSRGQFVLFGDVYGRVLVSRHAEAHYHRPAGGYGDLTKEILDRLDAEGFDFSRYDHNGDGLIDQIFLIVRRDSKREARQITWTGISCLDARCGGGLAAGGPRETLSYDGKTVDWNRSGSYILNGTGANINAYTYHVRMMAHELGHDLWGRFFTHLPALTSNDVPAKSNRGRTCVGYALMVGAGGGIDCRGDETISAFERDLQGWITCDVLHQSQAGIVLRDLYTTSDCKKIVLDGRSRVVYLTNRQRVGYFDQYRRGGRDGQYEIGLLRTTGLLVTLAEGVRYDVLPADNSLDLSLWNKDYEGDLFSPATRTQLTPWTRPNINGYTEYPENARPAWMALDNIRYTGGPGGEMAFDYVEDFRQHPIIREDSWMGAEMSGYAFTDLLVVTGGKTLTIETEVTIAGKVRVEKNARVVIPRGGAVTFPTGSLLEVQAGAGVVVEGVLRIEGELRQHPRSRVFSQNGGAIEFPDTGRN